MFFYDHEEENRIKNIITEEKKRKDKMICPFCNINTATVESRILSAKEIGNEEYIKYNKKHNFDFSFGENSFDNIIRVCPLCAEKIDDFDIKKKMHVLNNINSKSFADKRAFFIKNIIPAIIATFHCANIYLFNDSLYLRDGTFNHIFEIFLEWIIEFVIFTVILRIAYRITYFIARKISKKIMVKKVIKLRDDKSNQSDIEDTLKVEPTLNDIFDSVKDAE